MKRVLLVLSFFGCLPLGRTQTQIANSDFETWESVSSGEEPLNWNSFLTAGGSLSWAASDQCQSATDVRPGSTGTKSAYIFSNSTLGVIANGNLTVGKINMGSASPANSSNYNSSVTADADFSEALTNAPDSLVFWAKFTPASGNTTDSARVSAILHDAYDFRDPIDANSVAHTVAVAIRNYATTNGTWARIAVPFIYSGPATTPAFILLTFTTNKTPGGGTDNDQVWIDDVELVYNNTSGLTENSTSAIVLVQQNQILSFQNPNNESGNVRIYNVFGQLVHSGDVMETYTLNTKGTFLVHVQSDKGEWVKKIIQL